MCPCIACTCTYKFTLVSGCNSKVSCTDFVTERKWYKNRFSNSSNTWNGTRNFLWRPLSNKVIAFLSLSNLHVLPSLNNLPVNCILYLGYQFTHTKPQSFWHRQYWAGYIVSITRPIQLLLFVAGMITAARVQTCSALCEIGSNFMIVALSFSVTEL